jgi:hypothetical protein
MRRALAVLVMALAAVVPSGATAQERTYTVDEMAARCEAADAQIVDACLFVLYTILAPEAEIPLPDPTDERPTTSGTLVSYGGEGYRKTSPIQLPGGDYVLSWEVWDTDSPDVGCYHSSSLEATDGSFMSEGRVSEMLDGGERDQGETYAYGLAAGRYYFDVISGCSWQLEIRPL